MKTAPVVVPAIISFLSFRAVKPSGLLKVPFLFFLLSTGLSAQPAWHLGLGTVPALAITRTYGFPAKTQGMLRTELRAEGSLPVAGGFSIQPGLICGFSYTAPSNLEGGFAYSGISEFTAGLALGLLVPPRGTAQEQFRPGAALLFKGTYSRYENTFNFFFTPIAGAEVFYYQLLKSLKPDLSLALRMGLPLEWRFRRDGDIGLSAGLSVGLSLIGGVRE